MKPFFRFTSWLLPLLLIAACGTVTPPPVVERPLTEAPSAPAFAALNRGDYDEAIQRFTQLRDGAKPPQRQEYEIYIAEALHKSDRDQQAQQVLEQIAVAGLAPQLLMRRQLLRADIALRTDPQRALGLLLKPAAPASEQALHADFHLLRARAFNRLGKPLETARERVAREPFLSDSDEREANHVAIWQALGTLPREALEQITVQPPDTLSGWLELAALAKNHALPPEAVTQRLTVWHQQYPQHPVAQQFLDDLVTRSRELTQRPTTIALLLPLSGRFAQAGAAVRDGFLAAYYQSPGHEALRINVYDIGAQPEQALSSYRRAVMEGAQFVVGPLDKAAVQALAVEEQLPVPVLALNYAGEAKNDNFYQFSLAPEDEAIEAADRAWADGHSRIAVIVPDDPLGARMADAFIAHWQELGGFIAGKALYDAQGTDYSTPLEDLLKLSDSNARLSRLRQLLGKKLEFTPRRRQDIDALFVTAFPTQGRLLRPQLRFNYAGDLPVYSTSLVYGGAPDANQDRDLDGVMFCDTPWTLDTPGQQQAPRHAMLAQLPAYGGQLQRLVAMGVDAYQLVPMLRVLQSYPHERYQGETGTLRVGAGNRIQRQMQWALFHNGLPQPLDGRVDEKSAQ